MEALYMSKMSIDIFAAWRATRVVQDPRSDRENLEVDRPEQLMVLELK